MEKKTKLTISGIAKKSIKNIEIAKTQGKNSVVIEKQSNKFQSRAGSVKPGGFKPKTTSTFNRGATVKSSFSTIVGESRDFACILVDSKGRSLCQSSFSPPNFCVILPRTVKDIIEKIGINNINDGDVFVTNDPWIGTGHLPDYVFITPVFYHNKIVSFIGTVAHLSDVGGHDGDIEAEDVFTEGIRIPPSKLYNEYNENNELFSVIEKNCRVPNLVLGCLLYTSPSPRDGLLSRMPSSA